MTVTAVLGAFEETEALLSGHFRLSSGLHSDRYLQCAKVLQWPARAAALGKALASLFEQSKTIGTLDVVISPAMGGLVIGHEVGRALDRRAIFAERVDGVFTLRRGLSLLPGERAVVIEDVVTTGKSTREVFELVRSRGAVVAAAGAIVDRRSGAVTKDSAGETDIGTETEIDGVPFRALVRLAVSAWSSAECPLCKLGQDITAPGSRFLGKAEPPKPGV